MSSLHEQSVSLHGNTKQPTHALILVHGRGGSAADMARLLPVLTVPENTIVITPQAANFTWYPERFIVPQAANQPALDTALTHIHNLVSDLAADHQITPDNIALAGFSQGACLVAEYVKRHPTRYQAVAIWSGGLIGTDSEAATEVPGSLAHTPLYLGCDEVDFHIPAERVGLSGAYFKGHEALVEQRLYQGLGHTIHRDGIDFLARHLA